MNAKRSLQLRFKKHSLRTQHRAKLQTSPIGSNNGPAAVIMEGLSLK